MPCVEGKISGVPLTEELASRLENSITRSLQDVVSLAFPRNMGFTEGSKEFAVAHRIAREIMPGWTWISLSEARWAIRGRRVGREAITARFHVLVLMDALMEGTHQQIAVTLEDSVRAVLSGFGRPLNLFVDVIEGQVDMTLPRDLFGDLLAGASDLLLEPGGVTRFLMREILQEIYGGHTPAPGGGDQPV